MRGSQKVSTVKFAILDLCKHKRATKTVDSQESCCLKITCIK